MNDKHFDIDKDGRFGFEITYVYGNKKTYWYKSESKRNKELNSFKSNKMANSLVTDTQKVSR